MTKPQATVMPLTVKVVRECATKTLNQQRRFLDESLREVARSYNVRAELHNASRWTRFFRQEQWELLAVDEVIETWKKMWISGEMPGDHIARPEFWVTRTGWWKRLKQFEALPTADDDVTMQVSVEDLDLIDYNIWMKAK